MRIVTCGRHAAPKTTVSALKTMSTLPMAVAWISSPERGVGVAPAASGVGEVRAGVTGSQPTLSMTSTASSSEAPKSTTSLMIWMSAVPFIPPMAA